MRILGHRLHRHPAHLFQRRALDHRARPAEEGRVPGVVAVLQQAVEQLAFVGHLAEGAEVALERVGREEVVRRLHHRQPRVVQEPAHRHLQERARRHVVAVENGDVLAIGLLQRRVDVAGLGVVVVGAGDVVHPDFLAERAEFLAAAVIEQVDLQLAGRPVHHRRRQHGGAHHRQRFVVGGDEHVHRRPQRLVLGQRQRTPVQWPGDLEVAEHQHHERVDLGHHQAEAQGQVDHAAHAHGLGQPPPHVAAGHDQRQPHQQQRHDAVAGAPQAQADGEHRQREQQLPGHVQRHGDDEADEQHAHQHQRGQAKASQGLRALGPD